MTKDEEKAEVVPALFASVYVQDQVFSGYSSPETVIRSRREAS